MAAIIKRALVLTMRETDPATFMDESSLRLFELERGISIAIYGMKAERQLPFQSYIGYTLFKNGLPAAYGGSWMFGKRAMFGLNIFETYRGGESGFMMCQLLRVYIQVFELDYVEVEAYQFGLDNPDGIRSGAFWFYYRYGFRSLNKALNSLSAKEFQKIKQQKGYRSSEKILLQFTESNIVLKLQPAVHIKHSEIAAGITKMINVRFGGNRMLAEQKATAAFLQKTKMELPSNVNELQVLKEVALWAEAFQIKNKNQLQLMRAMIHLKPIDPYAYNQVIQGFFL